VETVRSGAYPFYKDFAFVTRGEPEGQAGAFIAFALSPAGRSIIAASGALPLVGSAPTAQEEP
jgi:ABC-type phosphate transport system substrate-binding protein